jgi:hypothetical protein
LPRTEPSANEYAHPVIKYKTPAIRALSPGDAFEIRSFISSALIFVPFYAVD